MLRSPSQQADWLLVGMSDRVAPVQIAKAAGQRAMTSPRGDTRGKEGQGTDDSMDPLK